jgi:predicted nucleotidyltransferase
VVQEPPPPLFPVFRSRLTAAVLTLTYLSAGEYTVAELAKAAHTDGGSMAREVARLERAAVVRSRRVGRSRLVSANTAAPFYPALHELTLITLGPAQVLREELGDMPDICYAAIFGSWAARAKGIDGPAAVDIDLLVVGRPDRDDIHDAASRATGRLGRQVNPLVVSPERWERNDDPFLAGLRAKPLVSVLGPEPADSAGCRQ